MTAADPARTLAAHTSPLADGGRLARLLFTMSQDAKRRLAAPPSLPRRDWVVALHRRPTRWDVLFHELAIALIRRYWHAQVSFRSDTLRLSNDELPTVALLLSRGVCRLVSTNAVSDLAGRPEPSLWDTDPAAREKLLAQATRVFADILCNYHELTGDGWIKRDHDDLRLILQRLTDALGHFLQTKCGPGGDLYPCIEDPLGDDEGFFPPGDKPADPDQTSGNPKLDAYRLNCLVHDADDADTIKTKLIAFVRSDPLLAPEQSRHIAQQLLAKRDQIKTPQDEFAHSYAANDDFLFNPGRQGGLTPVRLFLQTHLFLSDRQKQRLERWDSLATTGLFQVQSNDQGIVQLQDLTSGRSFRVTAGERAVLDQFRPGMGLQTRILPWDDLWVFSGIQKVLDLTPQILGAAMGKLNPMSFRRAIDNNDPRVLRAADLTRLAAAQWQTLFASDHVVSDTLETNRQTLERFYEHLRQHKLPAGGLTIFQAFEQEVGIPAPAGVPTVSLDPSTPFRDLTLLCSAQYGLVQLIDYDFVCHAMDAQDMPTPEQRSALWMYLSAPWIPAWVTRTLFERNPARVQHILRDLLGDGTFDLARDLDHLLGHFKPLDHGLPVRPRPWL